MRLFQPLRLEREEGDVLVIHKDRPSTAEDRGNCLLVLLLTCAAAMIPFGAGWGWDPSPSATFRWNRAIIGGEVLVLAVASIAVWVTYRRSVLGRWRIGGDRVEFLGRNGDRRSLARDEVDRVGMYGPMVRLVGRQGHISLDAGGIPEADRQQVRDRVEAILSPRFDLTGPQGVDPEFKLLRVLAAALPIALITLAMFWVMIQGDTPRSLIAFAVWAIAFAGFPIAMMIRIGRDSNRRIWRTPRPTSIVENPTGSEIV